MSALTPHTHLIRAAARLHARERKAIARAEKTRAYLETRAMRKALRLAALRAKGAAYRAAQAAYVSPVALLVEQINALPYDGTKRESYAVAAESVEGWSVLWHTRKASRAAYHALRESLKRPVRVYAQLGVGVGGTFTPAERELYVPVTDGKI